MFSTFKPSSMVIACDKMFSQIGWILPSHSLYNDISLQIESSGIFVLTVNATWDYYEPIMPEYAYNFIKVADAKTHEDITWLLMGGTLPSFYNDSKKREPVKIACVEPKKDHASILSRYELTPFTWKQILREEVFLLMQACTE